MIPSFLPGYWEVLENHDRTNSAQNFGRRSQRGYIDCIIIFDRVEQVLVVCKPKVIWIGHSPLDVPGTAIATFEVKNRMKDFLSEDFAALIARVGAMSRKDWRRCSSCNERKPSGYMQNRRVCMSCAPEVLGIIY